jgi:hypothetical protein
MAIDHVHSYNVSGKQYLRVNNYNQETEDIQAENYYYKLYTKHLIVCVCRVYIIFIVSIEIFEGK